MLLSSQQDRLKHLFGQSRLDDYMVPFQVLVCRGSQVPKASLEKRVL